jgi:hypothetical protein
MAMDCMTCEPMVLSPILTTQNGLESGQYESSDCTLQHYVIVVNLGLPTSNYGIYKMMCLNLD